MHERQHLNNQFYITFTIDEKLFVKYILCTIINKKETYLTSHNHVFIISFKTQNTVHFVTPTIKIISIIIFIK